MTSIYSISLFSVGFIAFMGSIWILFRTYKRTRYLAHLLQGISFCLLILNVSLRFTTSFFTDATNVVVYTGPEISITLVGILWALMNICLSFGIFLLFVSFLYIKMNSLHPTINIISWIMGINVFVFCYPIFTTLAYDSTKQAWSANYDVLVMITIIPLLVGFIIAIIIPLVSKIRHSSFVGQRTQIIIQIIGLLITLIWSALAATSSIEILTLIRPFLLPIGWLIWSVTLLMDPFNIMVSNAKINQIYIATESGLPFYFKDFEGSQVLNTTLAASIISGVKSALEELVQREDKITVLNYEKQVLGIVTVGSLRAYVFGERFDKILETVLRFSLQRIQNNPLYGFQLNQQVLQIEEESYNEISDIMDDTLKSVLTI